MDQVDELESSLVPYIICHYCRNLVRAPTRDGYKDGCKLRQNDKGKYVILVPFIETARRLRGHGRDAIVSYYGCGRFESSGLPAHPIVHESLIKQNPKAAEIPIDPDATEVDWDFEDKIGRYPHKELDSYDRIQ